MRRIVVFVCLLLLLTSVAFAHGGKTDKYGGHRNRKTGDYHYHNKGKTHDPSNLYQDHTKCGICKSVKKGM